MEKIPFEKRMLEDILHRVNVELEKDPENLKLLSLRSLTYSLNEEYQKAIEDCKNIIRLFPKDINAYFIKSDCHFQLEEYEPAKRDYMRAILLQDKDTFDNNEIELTKISGEEELADIKKVLKFEINKIITDYLSVKN